MRSLILCPVVIAIAAGGCTPPTTAELCIDRIEALCTKEAACRNDQPVEDCIVARKNDCATRPDLVLCANGAVPDPAASSECSTALRNSACAELNGGDQPAACIDACS